MITSTYRACSPKAIRVFGKDNPAQAVWLEFKQNGKENKVEVELTPEGAEALHRFLWKGIKALRGLRDREVTQIQVELDQLPDLSQWMMRESPGFFLAMNTNQGCFVVAREANQRLAEIKQGGTSFTSAPAEEVADFWMRWRYQGPNRDAVASQPKTAGQKATDFLASGKKARPRLKSPIVTK